MRILPASAALLLAAAAAAQSPPAATSCSACHADASRVPEARQRDPVAAFEADVHAARGLSCHDCHGGRPDAGLSGPQAMAAAHDPAAGFRGAPAPAQVPEFCGRCHSDPAFMGRFNPDARVDQVAKYHTSVHGQKLAEGDAKVAQCLSCHGRHPDGSPRAVAHGMRAVADPLSPVYPPRVAETCARCHADAGYMEGYGISTDQYEEYRASVHAEQMYAHDDLSAPTCNDCHGNHGAHPPEIEDLSFVCGTCHVRQAELFRGSVKKPAFDELGMGECIVCHSNHRVEVPGDAMLFHEPLAEGAAAGGCHACHMDAQDPALLASTRMYGALHDLDQRIAAARAVLHEAGAKGMLVAEGEYQLAGATDALVDARALVHGFRPEDVEAAVAKGREATGGAQAQGEAALQEFHFRNRWLALSLAGIAFVIVALLLKLRQVDRRWREGSARA